jgi:broad specificity phosphatase PhoE
MINEILKHYTENCSLSLLIRHADRDNIPQGSFGNDVLLNSQGKLNSLRFGESISELKVNRILTSPIGRCIQTAEYIAKGYRNSIEIIETTALGAPGLHISDEKVAGDFFLNYGFDEVYKQFLQENNIPGITKAGELNKSITNFLNENSDTKGITIFVTHDMLIAFYHYTINKQVYTKENWVKYLTGILLKDGIYEEST